MRDAASDGPHPPPARESSARRVLVVEDVDTTRRRISAALRANGYEVTEAANGADGWRLLSSSSFDAVLLDLIMPQFDGWQFRQNQLGTPGLADIPTIIVTVRSLTEPDKYALRARSFVQKPFDDQVLVAAVSDVCAQKWSAGRFPLPARGRSKEAAELFWSRRGEVACAGHAPAPGSDRWAAERWAPIPHGAGRDRIVYQCEHCSGCGPIRHRTPARTQA